MPTFSTARDLLTIAADATGPADAKHAIFYVFDIFGFFPQTLQGADILAYGNKERPYRVYMPDLFDGKPANIEWYPPDTPEKGEKMGAFFKNEAAVPANLAKIKPLLSGFQKLSPSVQSWGILGLCWGAKLVSLASAQDTPFKVAAECHPAMVDAADAEKITIPIIMLTSKDEAPEDVKKFEAALKVPHEVDTYPAQIHGWMGARGNLDDEKVKKEYQEGYERVLKFFHR